MNYILPQTAVSGLAISGVAVSGIYGIYTNVPEDPENPGNPVTPGHILFPREQQLQLYVKVTTVDGYESDIYPIRGSLTWEDTVGDSVGQCSFTVVAHYTKKPECQGHIEIYLEHSAYLLFDGQIKSITETYNSGSESEGNYLCNYQVSGVGRGHSFVRNKINIGFRRKYARDIIQKIFSRYYSKNVITDDEETSITTIQLGRIEKGAYYDKVEFAGETALQIFAKLAEDSECIFYLDSRTQKFHFVQYGYRTAPYNIYSQWSFTTHWNFPSNNYHNLTVSQDGSQIATKVLIHGKKFIDHVITYQAYDGIYPGEYPISTDDQKTFYTDTKIYRILDIKYAITYSRIVDDSYTLTTHEKYQTPTMSTRIIPAKNVPLKGWDSVTQSYSIDYSTEAKKVAVPTYSLQKVSKKMDRKKTIEYTQLYDLHDPNEQLGIDSTAYNDEEQTKPIDYLLYSRQSFEYFRTRDSAEELPEFINTAEKFGDTGHVGTVYQQGVSNLSNRKTAAITGYGIWRVPWVVRKEDRYDDYDDQQLQYDEEGNAIGDDELEDPLQDVPTLWDINYDSNTITYTGELYNTETFMSRITYVYIKYQEYVDEDYSYTNITQVSKFGKMDNGTGIYEAEFTLPEITNAEVAKDYANEIFKDSSQCKLSASYSCYQKGLDIMTQPVRVGMSQILAVRGYNESLIIESIKYSLQKGTNIPIFKLDISLNSKPRNMSRVLTRLLRKHK